MQERAATPPTPSQAFEPYKCSIHISLTEIEIQDATQTISNAALRRRLVGQARLDGNESISRAGDEHSASSSLTIGISPITAEQAHLTSPDSRKKPPAAKPGAGAQPAPDELINPSFPGFRPALLNTHGNASLGYIEPDWEYDVLGHWYVELELIDEAFNRLVELVEQGRLRGLSISLDLPNLLVDHGRSILGTRLAKLYLAPDGNHANESPQDGDPAKNRWMRSDGWITSLQARSSSTLLRSDHLGSDSQADNLLVRAEAGGSDREDGHDPQRENEMASPKLVKAIESLGLTLMGVGLLISLAIYMSSR